MQILLWCMAAWLALALAAGGSVLLSRPKQELVAAGLMEPVSTFAGRPEALDRLTEEADRRRDRSSRPGRSNPTVDLRELSNRCPLLPRQCLRLDQTPVPPVGD